MQTVLIVIHLLIVIALVGVVLIQRSEGGGLGIGGGSGFMTARGTKNALTRLTAILALCFFATSIALVVLDSISNPAADIINRIPVADKKNPVTAPATPSQAVPNATNSQLPDANLKQPETNDKLDGKDANSGENQTKPEGNAAVPAGETPVPQQPENPVPNN